MSPGTTSVSGMSLALAVPQDGRADVRGLPKPLRGASGSMLLHEIQDDAEEHHHQDHDEAARVPGQLGDCRGAEQKQDQRVAKPQQQLHDNRTPVSVRDDVPAVHHQPFGRLLARQPSDPGPEAGEQVRRRLQPRRIRLWHGGLHLGGPRTIVRDRELHAPGAAHLEQATSRIRLRARISARRARGGPSGARPPRPRIPAPRAPARRARARRG